ncbi:uncharacterized protein PHACADRAFT_263144, partial [Phanerochaete carnosa HHB-10118-sp]
MSKTAKGTVVTSLPSLFQAKFIVDGIVRTYIATIDPPVAFKIGNATLSYDDEDQLTARGSHHGTIGTAINLSLDKGPIITGNLQQPVDPTDVTGGGTWHM